MHARIGALILLITLAAGLTPAWCEEPIITESLPNGARLVLQERSGCGTYAIQILALGGSLEDTDSQVGLTEVLSRMLLRGSLKRTGSDQALEIEQTGSRVESVAGALGFSVRAEGPSSAITAVLPVVADAMLKPRLDPADLKTEIGLARLRLARSLDVPSSARQRTLLPLLFGGHPLGRVADPDNYLAGLTLDNLRRAHQGRVVGARLIVVVVGEFDTEGIRHELTGLLAELPAGSAPVRAASPEPLSAERHARAKRHTSQPEIVVALPTEGLSPREEPVMDFLGYMLGGFQERLSTEIREKRGWAYWLSPLDWRLPEAGAFGIVTAVPRKHLAETERLIHEEFKRIATVAPTESEMDRTRRYLLTARARECQQSDQRAARYAADTARGLPAGGYTEFATALASVTPDAIRALARKLLDGSATVTVMLY